MPVGRYEIPIGEPDVKKVGKDLTILTIGATLYRALEAARTLEEKYGVSCEVIDARSIVPFNFEKVSARYFRIVVAAEGPSFRSIYKDGFPFGVVELHADTRIEDIPGKGSYARHESYPSEPPISPPATYSSGWS